MESSCDVINQVNLRARNDSFFWALQSEEKEHFSVLALQSEEKENFSLENIFLVLGDARHGKLHLYVRRPHHWRQKEKISGSIKIFSKTSSETSQQRSKAEFGLDGAKEMDRARIPGPQTRPSYSSLYSTPHFTSNMKTTAPPVSSLLFPMEEQKKKTTSGSYWLNMPPMGPPIRPMDLTAPLPRLTMPDYWQPIEIFPLPERERPQRQELVPPSAFELMVIQKCLRMEREELEREAAAQEEYQRYRNTVLAEAQRLARKRRLNSMHERPAYAKKPCYSVSSYGTSWPS
ncbi:uncharacterized protein LOC121399055 isoform X4 [Xenopus laevis]|uniref:Uncharacterized protein LOC121399055 isoform X3 n=1 Tax=Xenopus laevis TaxID=8355 RepID=A0A8J1LZ95_XENLA|nr:uncharacterized protein LOC121399055 isoform X3 [Xenopus laevis]XP_041434797.1 uncharacterized protein LOC121399055 isoform X3 [Xenopus laevis]XP_041434798.1 uncharacterized protein LOC121399055 isoform X4 [Xenopus laevis]XP_041434799.1 uncharacterized protein LOC121399055 isoform X4 [Xenopus laevis]